MTTKVEIASGIAKRYATEIGSSWVRSIVTEAELIQKKLPPLTFIAADEDLLEAAEAEGLPAENPNLHP
ncbi:MAG TPA: hypothetical protein EYP09_00430 [Anaerolineae bacterium]|nr:hypothetical protein [Anaerolineae bacterium]